MAETHKESLVVLDKMGSVADFSEVATRMKIYPDDASRAASVMLQAWEEPVNPIFDPLNYGMLERGKFNQDALIAVPFVLALGGLYSRSRPDPLPETVAKVAEVVSTTAWNFREAQYSADEVVVRATRRGLAIVETFAPWTVFGRDQEAREAIKKSGVFGRRELKSILKGASY